MNAILNVYNIFVVCFADMVCYFFVKQKITEVLQMIVQQDFL